MYNKAIPNLPILIIIAVISLTVGALAIVPVVKSENGYVGSIAFFFLFILVCIVTVILFLAGLLCLPFSKKIGISVLTSTLMLPVGFFGAAITSKHFEIGAYKEQPMRPIIPQTANKVIFKKDATHDEVQAFWREVLSEPVGETGSKSRPGIQAVASNPDENGHEVVTFAFFENATEEQKADIRRRINEYEPVLEFLEDVDTTPKLRKVENDPYKQNTKGISREPDTFTIKR